MRTMTIGDSYRAHQSRSRCYKGFLVERVVAVDGRQPVTDNCFVRSLATHREHGR